MKRSGPRQSRDRKTKRKRLPPLLPASRRMRNPGSLSSPRTPPQEDPESSRIRIVHTSNRREHREVFRARGCVGSRRQSTRLKRRQQRLSTGTCSGAAQARSVRCHQRAGRMPRARREAQARPKRCKRGRRAACRVPAALEQRSTARAATACSRVERCCAPRGPAHRPRPTEPWAHLRLSPRTPRARHQELRAPKGKGPLIAHDG